METKPQIIFSLRMPEEQDANEGDVWIQSAEWFNLSPDPKEEKLKIDFTKILLYPLFWTWNKLYGN